MDACKSTWPDGIHPTVLKELPGVIAGPLSIIVQQSGASEEVPVKWKLPNFAPVFKKEDRGNCRSASIQCLTELQRSILGVTEKYLKDNVVTGRSQEGVQEAGSSV